MSEIIEIMDQSQIKHVINICFTLIVELEKNCNYFVCTDKSTKELLTKTLEIDFKGQMAKRDGLIMRKEIVPLLKDYIEKE